MPTDNSSDSDADADADAGVPFGQSGSPFSTDPNTEEPAISTAAPDAPPDPAEPTTTSPPSMNERLARVPWHIVRDVLRVARQTVFSKPKPDVDGIFVTKTPDEMVPVLGRQGYHPNWEFSYYYLGEAVNLTRTVYAPTKSHPDIDWWQVHVRGWPVENDAGDVVGTELIPHWEPAPTEHPKAHLRGVGFDRAEGARRATADLEAAGLPIPWNPMLDTGHADDVPGNPTPTPDA